MINDIKHYLICLFLTFSVLANINLIACPSDVPPSIQVKDQTPDQQQVSQPCVVVIFGATGDLTAKKLMPALYHLTKEGRLSENTIIVGFARRDLTHEAFRRQMGEAVDRHSRERKSKDDVIWKELEKRIYYVRGDLEQPVGYDRLSAFLAELDKQYGTQGNRLYYLATPPGNFPSIVDQLSKNQLIYDFKEISKWSRVVIEKPFGTDLETAEELQAFISKRLNEDQIYRVDHYLGKEGVQDLIAFRFVDHAFESVWNREHIDYVQITLSEDAGIGTRGNFWEQTGALRDLLQNHVMQLLTLTAMEPPRVLNAENLHQEKAKVLAAIRSIPASDMDRYIVSGQYGAGIVKGNQVVGYREEQDVSKTSNVETYVAAKLFIDNERWQGVPFYLRCGKRLSKQIAEIVITFKAEDGQGPDQIYIRIQPDPGICFKTTGRLKPPVIGKRLKQGSPEAYEKLIYDSVQGDNSLFVPFEEQQAAWRLLTPVLEYWKMHPSSSFPNYPAGSLDPIEANKILEPGHRFHQ